MVSVKEPRVSMLESCSSHTKGVPVDTKGFHLLKDYN